jgi:hypothetical protein
VIRAGAASGSLGMRTFAVETLAPPGVAWRLLARPGEWSRWSPHVRGAWGLGAPEVRPGATGAARLFGAVPVPVRVTAKRDGRSWTWRVAPGLVEMVHRVEPAAGGGATVMIELHAPAGLEAALAAAYGPVIRSSLRRLARAAEDPTAT